MNLKQEIIYYSKLCYRNRYLSAADGNLSVRTRKNYIITTPTQTCKGFLASEDLVKADINGNKIQGKGNISTEFKLHKFIYERRRDVNAVIHTHPVFSTAFASAGIALDKIVFPEIYLRFGKIPLAAYATPSTDEVPESIAGYVEQYDAILLANHGLVTFGSSLKEAYFRTEKTEHIAEVSFYARLLGGERELTESEIVKLDKIKRQFPNSKQNKNRNLD